jgi:hypothetical protein
LPVVLGQSDNKQTFGHLEKRLEKVMRIAEKSKFDGKISSQQLADGHPSPVLRVLHHLVFRTSASFSKLIQNSEWGQKLIKFYPDAQFYSSLKLMLADLFGFRISMSAD